MHAQTATPSGGGRRPATARSTAPRVLICALALIALASPLPPVRADTVLNDICMDAGNVLPGLAAEDPSTFSTDGCAASAPGLICEISATGGTCSSNPRCTPDLIEPNSCTPDTEELTCCVESLIKDCPSCEPTVAYCLEVCPESTSDTPVAPPSRDSPNDYACRAVSSGLLAELATEAPEAYSPGCGDSLTAAGTVCDLRGRGGTCDAFPECADVPTTVEGCPATIPEDAPVCCTVVFIAPCAGCPGVSTECIQVCPGSGSAAVPGAVPSPLDAPFDSPQPAIAGQGPAPSLAVLDVADSPDPEAVAQPPATASEMPAVRGEAPVGPAPEQPPMAPVGALPPIHEGTDVVVLPAAGPVDAPGAADADQDADVVVPGLGILDVGDVDGPAADAPVATPVPAPAQPPAAVPDAPTAATREFEAGIPAATDAEVPAPSGVDSAEQDPGLEEEDGGVDTEDSSVEAGPLEDVNSPAEVVGAGSPDDASSGDGRFRGGMLCAAMACLAAARLVDL